MNAYGYYSSSSSSSEEEEDYGLEQEEEVEERPVAIASPFAPVPIPRPRPRPQQQQQQQQPSKARRRVDKPDKPDKPAACVCPRVRRADYDKGLEQNAIDKLIEPIPAASAAAIAEAVKAVAEGEDLGRIKPARLMRRVLDAFDKKSADVVYRGSGGLLGAFRVRVNDDDAPDPLSVACLHCDAAVPCVLKQMEHHVRTSDSKNYVDYLAFRLERDGDTASIAEIKDAINGKVVDKKRPRPSRPAEEEEDADDKKNKKPATATAAAATKAPTAPATPAPARRRPPVVPPSPDAVASAKAVDDAVRRHARALKAVGRAHDIPDFLDAVAALPSSIAADFGRFLVGAYEPFALAAPEFDLVFDPDAQTVRVAQDFDGHVAVVGREAEPPSGEDELGMDFTVAEILARARKACKDLAIPAVANVAIAALRAAAAGGPDRAADAFAIAAAGLKTAATLFVAHRQVTGILRATADQVREALRAGKTVDQIELEWDEAAFGKEHMRLVEATEVDKHREACAWLRRRADVARDMIDEVVKTLRFVETGYIDNGPTARAIRTALDNADEDVRVRDVREANERVAAIERWASGRLAA